MTAPQEGVQERKFHADASSKYTLPNDSYEHNRLETQHKCFATVLKGRVSNAPVSDPSQILDIGCGTGAVTTWFAEKFPAATVTGLDLSPVPKLHEQPGNVRYLQGNILQQSPRDWTSEDGDRPIQEEKEVFDLIFSRLVVLGINDWQEYLTKQFSLLKPGGWAECQEFKMVFYDAEDQVVDNWDVFNADAAVTGVDPLSGEKMKAWMEEVGYEMVNSEIHNIPLGGQGQATQELEEIGAWFIKNLTEVSEVTIRRGKVDRTPEEAETLLQNTKNLLAKANGWHMKFYATYGRKPE